MELHDGVALVTGGAVRLGREMAFALAGKGMHVAFTYHTSRAAASEVEAAIRAHGSRSLALGCDQRREEDVRAAVERVTREMGRLDVLVNSAAVFRRTPWDQVDAS